jgi:ketosteroid isomerase-like protein
MDARIKSGHDYIGRVGEYCCRRTLDSICVTMTEQDESDIRALFAAYGEGLNNADAEAVTPLFAWPATIWQFGEGHVFEEVEDLAENIDALIDVFDEAGIAVTTPDVKEVRVFGTTAFAHVAWRQEDSAGELLHEFSCQYLLVHEAGRWRIATIVNEDQRGNE